MPSATTRSASPASSAPPMWPTPCSGPTSSRSRSCPSCCWRPSSGLSPSPEGTDRMLLNQFLFLAAVLFCIGVYGVLARRNAVLVLASIELMLNAVNINLVAFGAYRHNIAGQVFALFVITIAAAEVGVGLAIVVLIFRNRASIALDEADLMKG